MTFKFNLKLKYAIILAISAMIIVLVLAYTALAEKVYMDGMDNIIASNLVLAARHHAELQKCQQDSSTAGCDHLQRMYLPPQSPTGAKYQVSSTWQAQPELVHDIFPEPPQQLNKLHKAPPTQHHSWYFAIKSRYDAQDYFVSFHVERDTIPRQVGENIRNNIKALHLTSALTTIAMAVIFLWLFKKFTKPIQALGTWAGNINQNNLKADIPDFSFPELNEFAALIRQSLNSAQQGIEREQNFLKYTSHELRTPIAVLQNNIELIKKIKQEPTKNSEQIEARILQRIERASFTMRDLCETLLWLSYEEEVEQLPSEPLQLDALINELTGDLAYLLQNKNVTLESKLQPLQLSLPKTAARIVISNLIRNAFQHTWHGKVSIHLSGHTLTIVNQNKPAGDTKAELGFGLGLKLTLQLSEKLGWRLSSRIDDTGYRAELIMLESQFSKFA